MFFKQLQEWGLKVSWNFINIGKDFKDYRFRIKPEEISAYASYLIEQGNGDKSLTDLIFVENFFEMSSVIDSLASRENCTLELERRKWTVYVLNECISLIASPPTNDDLFMLGDLYYYLDRPSEYPWHNEWEYIKCPDVQKMICDHKEWILREVEFLRLNEKNS